MSDFPLTSGRKKARFGGPKGHRGPYGNRIEIQVVSGEVLQDPEYGLFVARGVATFKVILHPAPGFHAVPSLVTTAAANITIDFQKEPVSKLIVGGWFSNKPLRPYAQPPNNTPWPDPVDEKTEFIQAWVRTADLDIDSNNVAGPGVHRSMDVDSMEAPAVGTATGKVLAFCPKLDTDVNGVPDFADGIDVFGNAGNNKSRQWPVAVLFLQGFNETEANPAKVRFEYPGSDPAAVTRVAQPDGTYTYAPASGKLRIWTQNGNKSRLKASVPAGNYIKPGQAYLFSDLDDAKVAQGHWRFFMEPIGGSSTAADTSIEVWVDPYSQGHWVKVDHVSLTLLPVSFTVSHYNPQVSYPDPAVDEQGDYFRAGFSGLQISPGDTDVTVAIQVGASAAASLLAEQNKEAKLWKVGFIHNMTSYDLLRKYGSAASLTATVNGTFPLSDSATPPFYRKSSNFAGTNQSVTTDFFDAPFDPKAYWIYPAGSSNQITVWHLKATFTTWLAANRDGTLDNIYLKCVKWSCDNSATIDMTKPVGQRVTISRTASIIIQGEGQGTDLPKLVGPTTNQAIVLPDQRP